MHFDRRESAVRVDEIGPRESTLDRRYIVIEECIAHTQGLEDVGLHPLDERDARHLLDDFAEQNVAGVAVKILLAGSEVQLPLPLHVTAEIASTQRFIGTGLPASRDRPTP